MVSPTSHQRNPHVARRSCRRSTIAENARRCVPIPAQPDAPEHAESRRSGSGDASRRDSRDRRTAAIDARRLPDTHRFPENPLRFPKYKRRI